MIIRVKNMVCPRCVESVTEALKELGIRYENVALGRIELNQPPPHELLGELALQLNARGFETITNKTSELVSSIKVLLLENLEKLKLGSQSEPRRLLLENKLNRNYNYLSTIFSEQENKTLEQYWIDIRLELAKELLELSDKSITEISYILEFSSSQYFAQHFKKQTGLTPSEYKKNKVNSRVGLVK